ncbi:hypothetical protein [Rhizobium sp.]|uniref:hypothetical protein n=1 Tax=Rhizobium sp. TaxID=391 RepID=UPI002EE026A8
MTILFAFGMPGVMSSWGAAALHAVAREAYGEYAVISTDKVEDLRQHVQNRTKAHAVLVSQFPEAKLSELILRVNLPYMLFLENPIDAVSYLARSTEQQDLGLVRAVSASLACLEPIARAPTALIMRRNDVVGRSGIDMLLRRIDEHFSIDLTADQIANALLHLGMRAPGKKLLATPPKLEEAAAAVIAGYAPPQKGGSELSQPLHQAIEKVLLPLEIGHGDISGQPISWPRETFFSGDRPNESIEDSIDLTGGARCIIYGPYFHLPPGRWSAKLAFNIDEDCYGQIFTIEVHSGETLGKLRVCPEGTGSFETTMHVDIVEPQIPIEIRFMMDSGAIEGRLSGWTVEWQRAA